MKFEIDVPDEVIEKIEHMIALDMTNEDTMADYLVGCVIESTRCTLEGCNVILPREWPDAETPA